MKDNNIKKAAQESLRRIEEQHGPERAAGVKAARKAFGEYLFAVIGYCDYCASPIENFDRFILREGFHLCLDCFNELMADAFEEEEAEKASRIANTVLTRR